MPKHFRAEEKGKKENVWVCVRARLYPSSFPRSEASIIRRGGPFPKNGDNVDILPIVRAAKGDGGAQPKTA